MLARKARYKLLEMLASDKEGENLYKRLYRRVKHQSEISEGRNERIYAKIVSLSNGPDSLSQHLRDIYREPVRLHLRGKSYAEIADQLARNVATVRSQVYRGLQDLRKVLLQQQKYNTYKIQIVFRLGKLKEPYRTIVFLRFVEGQTYSSITDTLDFSMEEATIRQYASRGLKMLDIKS